MPVPPHILKGLQDGATKLGTKEGYSGYGAEQGQGPLRAKISENLYGGRVAPEEVFVSDGSKCDIGRLQVKSSSTQHAAASYLLSRSSLTPPSFLSTDDVW